MEVAANGRRIGKSSELFNRGDDVSKNDARNIKVGEVGARDGKTVDDTRAPVMAHKDGTHRGAKGSLK